jgi:phosphonoacetate hydrolase
MPREREGDFIAVGDTYTAIGSWPDEHDLAGLTHRPRSHGGLSEQPVPFMLSRPLNATYRAIAKDRRLRHLRFCFERDCIVGPPKAPAVGKCFFA